MRSKSTEVMTNRVIWVNYWLRLKDGINGIDKNCTFKIINRMIFRERINIDIDVDR